MRTVASTHCQKAIQFLGANTNRHLVRTLWLSCYATTGILIDDVEKYSDLERAAIFYRLVGFIVSIIPWADEFAKLSGKTKLPNIQSSYAGVALQWVRMQAQEVEDKSGQPMTVSKFFLREGLPELCGMEFDHLVDRAKYEQAVNQIQYDGGKLVQSLKSKNSKIKGFGYS